MLNILVDPEVAHMTATFASAALADYQSASALHTTYRLLGTPTEAGMNVWVLSIPYGEPVLDVEELLFDGAALHRVSSSDA